VEKIFTILAERGESSSTGFLRGEGLELGGDGFE
jgi:hypothetical protein